MAKAKEEKKGEKTFQERIKDLEQKWGVQQGKAKEKAVVSTGSYQLNRALGTGGYVKGKIVEIFGPESTGKSTIVLHALKEHQLAVPDRVAVLIDFEHSFDLTYAKRIGVDLSPERFRLYQPDYMEQGYEMVLGLAENKMASVIVLDSHTSAIPKVVLEGDMTDATYAAQARVNSMFLLKSKSILDRTDTSLLAISQLRSKIGGMSNEGDKPTGGNGWKFYADMRFKLWKKLEKEKELNETHVDVVKNKCAPPFGEGVFNINWGEGIDNYLEILDMALEYKLMTRNGSWYSHQGSNIANGKDAMRQFFQDNDAFYSEIRDQVVASFDQTVEKIAVEETGSIATITPKEGVL